ncbi:putative leader peptide [Planotetraspora sp. A-T 1434]
MRRSATVVLVVRSALLTSRDHIDLCRMSSALCRP